MTAVLVVLAIAACGVVVATAQAGNPKDTSVDPQDGDITFDTATKEVGADPEEYTVQNGHRLELILTLVVEGEGEAVFASPPVEFPKGAPPDFRWRPINPRQVLLTELNNNSSGEPEEYFFKARVKFDDEIYKSPDPTIINEPPTE